MKINRSARLYNNLISRCLFRVIYLMKRIPLLTGCSIRKKILISFLFVSTVPLLCSGIAQYIYTSSTYPRQLELTMREALRQADKNITNELNALARDRNLLLLNTDLIRELDFDGYLTEEELITKIKKVDEILSYANNTINSLYDSQKSITAYVDWNTIGNAHYYFNTPFVSTIENLPKDFLDFAAQGGQRPYWRGLHRIPNRLDGTYVSILNPIVNFDYDTIGYIEINLESRELIKLFDDITLSENATIFLLNTQNQVIGSTEFATDAPRDWHSLFEKASNAPTDIFKYDGCSVITKTNSLSGFRLVAAIPSGDLSHQLNNTIFVTFIILLGCILLSLVMAFPISYSIYSPITKLSTAMQNAQTNQYATVLQTNRTDEIGVLYHSFNEMERKIHDLIESVYRSEIELKEAELNLLQSNINPHFLYNTLDTINWLAVLNKEDEIALIARSLADIFRYSLSRGQSVIPVKDELKLVQNYVSIQHIRLGGKVTVSYDIDDAVYQYKMLKILLQPLVENAFLHGMKRKDRALSVFISARIDNGSLIFTVRDNGPGADIDKLNEILKGIQQDKGYGIRNVNKRIKLFYGEDYGLSYQLNTDGGLTATVCINAVLPEKEITNTDV